MKNQLSELLSQEMDRGQFLRYMAVGIMMMAGGNAVIQALTAMGNHHATQRNHGYGSTTYGGKLD
jgi:hypothetical protein